MIIGVSSTLFFIAVKYMPVADALAVFFVEPLILTVLSAIILGEKVGWRRRIAVVTGFIGALIVIQPSYALLGAVSLLPLGTAFLFAVYLILNRTLAADDSPIVMQMVAGLGASFVAGAAMLAGFAFGFQELAPVMPRYGISWLILLTVGLVSAVGHLMVVHAFQKAESSLLAPFQYLEIVTGTLLGILLFSDVPDLPKSVGIAIIVASGLYTFWRERRVREGTG
jgi:drug/metabolite transporter (DMT)-like permease